MNCREEIIQNIKDCGQSLIDNAEEICGNYEYSSGLVITCHVTESDGQKGVPKIVVERGFYPEKFIERVK